MRIGILSAARIAPKALLMPAASIPGVQVICVAARDLHKAQQFAQRHSIETAFGSYEELCTSELVDAIYIATPASFHKKWALAAIDGGKHVLLEKPFTANAQDAREVVEAGKAANVVVMEAFHWRFHPMAERVAELVRTAIGPIVHVQCRFDVGHIPPTDIRFDYELGGGATMDLGCYALNWARHVGNSAGLGEPQVKSAQALLGPKNVDISLDAQLQWTNGATATVSSSMEWGIEFGSILKVEGENGTIEVQGIVAPQGGNSITLTTAEGTTTESVELTPTYTFQLEAFLAACKGGPNITGGQEAIANMVLIDAMYTASGLALRKSQ